MIDGSDGTESGLIPGPYTDKSEDTGMIYVYLGGPKDIGDDVVVLMGLDNTDWTYLTVTDAKPSEYWPAWWPWPEMDLPEQPYRHGEFAKLDGDEVMVLTTYAEDGHPRAKVIKRNGTCKSADQADLCRVDYTPPSWPFS